ncbi:phage portal protein [Mesorhizobium sp.]|uniref:phage portal protein n=1 Tax=Mesorhizobium sp. TaxID=1871066 RepID=UPI0025BA26DF|nr:phage portal protein [Mesorhizobium sp.]
MWPFNRKQAAAIEQKSLAQPDEDLLALLGVNVTGTAAVATSVALTVPAVAAAVKTIAEAAATLPITVKRCVDGVEEDVPNFSALALLTNTANPWTSGYELIRDLISQALTSDKGGLAWVNKAGGSAREIIRYDGGILDVAYASDGSGEPTYRLNGKVIPPDQIVHVRGAFSKCPLTLCAEAIGVAHVLETHVANLFTNGARPGGIIKFPQGVKIGDTALGKMRTAWQQAFGGAANTGKTALLWDGGDFLPLTFSSVDAQLLELRKFQVIEVARSFRIPPQMLFELDRATWSNSEQMAREFIRYTLMPWLRALESAFNRVLLTDEERGEYRFCFDLDDTSQADLTARATAISTLITARVLNANEGRDWLGLPPRAGGEAYENPAITPGAAANDNRAPAQAAA